MALGALLVTVSHSGASDVVVYGDHEPVELRNGRDFHSPLFTQAEVGDPMIESRYRVAPGISMPLGSQAWGHDAFGKYIIGGTYANFFYGFSEDLILNILDSEEEVACDLDVTGSLIDPPGFVTARTIQVASPGARQSRIYFSGSGAGWSFGYIEADLDNPDPCNWVGVPLVDQFGEQGAFDYDGMAVLWHDDAPGDPYGIDYVILHNWLGQELTLARIDQGGATLLDVYPTPILAPPGQCAGVTKGPCSEISICSGGGDCAMRCPNTLNPVQLPSVDLTSPISDRRWVTLYEFRPGAGVGNCGHAIGAGQEFSVDLTSPTPSILPLGPSFMPGPGYDGLRIRGGIHPGGRRFDAFGGFWATDRSVDQMPPVVWGPQEVGDTCLVDGIEIVVGDPTSPVPVGERCFYDPSRTLDLAMVDPDAYLDIDDPGSTANNSVQQEGELLYVTSRGFQARAQRIDGAWQMEPRSEFRVALPVHDLPREPRVCDSAFALPCRCPAGTPPDQDCMGASTCQPGVMCLALPEGTFKTTGQARVLTFGGAPRSLWSGTQVSDIARTPKHELYWTRTVLQGAVPDGAIDGPVGAAWDGARLWVAATRGGVPSFRIRDAGHWSAWHSLPGIGSPAHPLEVVASSSGVEAFSRGNDGQVYRTTLLSSTTCAPSSCAWAAWSPVAIGGSIDPTSPSVAYEGGGLPFYVARNQTDSGVYFAQPDRGGPSAVWTDLPGISTVDQPDVTWHPSDGKFWIAAQSAETGEILVARVDPVTRAASAWEVAGRETAPDGGLSGPSILSDGDRIRVVATAPAASGAVYRAHYNASWSRWTPVGSKSTSSAPATAVAVVRQVNILTRANGALHEELGLIDSGCSVAPMADCKQSVQRSGNMSLQSTGRARRKRLKWRFGRGQSGPRADLGDLTLRTHALLCVYDASARPQPLMELRTEPSSKWSQRGRIAGYKDSNLENDGILVLKVGVDETRDNTRILAAAKGARVPIADLPLTGPVTVQLQTSDAGCWSATYDEGIVWNDERRFRARPSVP
ncbi:MAG: hypothetical protein P8R42_11455 [Candidatus Binatia bacterium]|nr:hypothetical protein [Candidatus Binatia bacterium]